MASGEASAVNVELRPNGEFSDEALTELFEASWPSGEGPRFLLDRSLCWVSAYAGERLVGFINITGDGGAHAFLLDATVHPEFRRHGVGSALVRCAMDEARELGAEWLHVDYAPHHAEFYRRSGFRPTLAGLVHLLPGDASDAAAPPRLTLRKYATADASACRELMLGLNDWFAISTATEAYLADLPRLPTWVATLGNDPAAIGFVSITAPQGRAFEIHVLAVSREHHRQGVGRALMQHAEHWSKQRGARYLQVKTLGPSHPDPAYQKTRAFYQSLDYEPLLETDKFWGPGNPTLLLVKSLLE
jgi:GNAT superfamily N-acetyltransferase